MTKAATTLRMAPVLRSERDQLYAMVDEYWQQIRPQGSHFANDPAGRAKYFDAEFWDEHESRFLWWAKLDETVVGIRGRPRSGRSAASHRLPGAFRGCRARTPVR